MRFLNIDSARSMGNVARNMLRPGYAREMVHKLFVRLREPNVSAVDEDAVAWCEAHCEDAKSWATAQSETIWQEAETFEREQERIERERVASLGIHLAGGAFDALLYFLARLHRPEYVLETGVAAGHSSRALLCALSKNGAGHLWSSDFPLFRLDQPESYIGVMVEPELRTLWTCLTKGDRANLPHLLAEMPRVDLFHFDSDKSVSGRNFAFQAIKPKLHKRSVVVFDDIQDNGHFQQLVAAHQFDYKVFKFKGKYIGVATCSR